MVLDDPYDDPPGLSEHIPDRSPEPTKEQLAVSNRLLMFTQLLFSLILFGFKVKSGIHGSFQIVV